MGAVYFQDHWQIGDRLATTFGGRYTYVGFLQKPNHLDPSLGLELPYRYYVAFLGGKPVAASMLFLAEGVAGIYSVATLPEAPVRFSRLVTVVVEPAWKSTNLPG